MFRLPFLLLQTNHPPPTPIPGPFILRERKKGCLIYLQLLCMLFLARKFLILIKRNNVTEIEIVLSFKTRLTLPQFIYFILYSLSLSLSLNFSFQYFCFLFLIMLSMDRIFYFEDFKILDGLVVIQWQLNNFNSINSTVYAFYFEICLLPICH